MTFGTNLYSVSLVSGLYGLWNSRFEEHTLANFRSLRDFWLLNKRASLGWLALITFGPSWKGYSIPVKLFMKCFLPNSLLQFYMFGYSDRWVKHTSLFAPSTEDQLSQNSDKGE